MYYFKYTDTNIEKYVVYFNRDELTNLRHKVITNCSEMIHREIDSDEELSNNSRIRNLKRSNNGDTYHYSYDEYIYPRLVSIIDRLLRNDDKVIDTIANNMQNDIINLKDEMKKVKLTEYYNRLKNMLSFELLTVINFNEPKTIKRKQRRILKKHI